MGVKVKLDFCYKGDRNYVHGTDIFNKTIEVFSKISGENTIANINLSLKRISKRNLVLCDEYELPLNAEVNGIFSCEVKLDTVRWFLVETENEIECRYPYAESNIIEASIFDRSQQIIMLNDFEQYTLIERIVALNKGLLNNLFPNAPGKWYFSKIKLVDIDLTLLMKRQVPLMLRLKRNLQFRMTETIISAENNEIGNIYFSLI